MSNQADEARRVAEKLTGDLVSLLVHMESTTQAIAKKSDNPNEINDAYLNAEFALSHWVAAVKQELRKLNAPMPQPLRRKHNFPAHRRFRKDSR
jgi:hypothetical protein